MKLVDGVLKGDRLLLARLLTEVENDTATGQKALDMLFPYTGKATLVGVTGAPGTGKSSLVNSLATAYRHPRPGSFPKRVAIVAVDPSSPFTGGALLGDRIRMRDLAGDPGVFIRSMSSRGHQGGLAQATNGLVQVLDAAGFELIMVETVGAGQAEVEVARMAHTTLVVDAPGLGDEIQAIKAGILEAADILVVNKADRPGVEQTEQNLRAMVEMSFVQRDPSERAGWTPPIVRTVAIRGEGLDELLNAIERHTIYLRTSGRLTERERFQMESDVAGRVKDLLFKKWHEKLSEDEYARIVELVYQRKTSPHLAAVQLMEDPVEEHIT